MQNLKISTRLTAAFALLVLMLLGVSALAAVQLSRMHDGKVKITDNLMVSVQSLGQLNTMLTKARLLELRHVFNAGQDYKANIEKEMQALQVQMNAVKEVYVKLMSSEREQQVYAEFMKERTEYVQLMQQLFAVSRSGDVEAARQMLGARSLELFTASEAALMQLIGFNKEYAVQTVQQSERDYRNAMVVMIACSVLAVLLALIGGIAIVRSIQRPLTAAVEAANRVASGNLGANIPVAGRDEISALLSALQRMQASLVHTVQTVRMGAQAVSEASTEIAVGNNDLSQRTERQAAALEETAASMEQLSSTIRQNADSAQSACQLASQASSVAVQGGTVMGQVVDTMRGINDSSHKIADIIGVIDSIAFQTNILALNAAVEAARAGEQGRGFAVVAGEVRSLAQRSAEAAKDIKGLISDSVGRVEKGTVLVDQAGNTMNEVVDAIRRVTHIVTEISAASSEQSQGVNQVGEAVSQMDQTTQQNAALVEQSAAAADSLRLRSQELVQSVDVFRLSADDESAESAALVLQKLSKVPTHKRSPKALGAGQGAGFQTAAPVAFAPQAVAHKAAASDDDDWTSM